MRGSWGRFSKLCALFGSAPSFFTLTSPNHTRLAQVWILLCVLLILYLVFKVLVFLFLFFFNNVQMKMTGGEGGPFFTTLWGQLCLLGLIMGPMLRLHATWQSHLYGRLACQSLRVCANILYFLCHSYLVRLWMMPEAVTCCKVGADYCY